MMQTARIENWSFRVLTGSNPYKAPEQQETRVLHGEVFGHIKHKDGTSVITGTIIDVNMDDMIARTERTIYELGTPSSDFIKWLNNRGNSLKDYK